MISRSLSKCRYFFWEGRPNMLPDSPCLLMQLVRLSIYSISQLMGHSENNNALHPSEKYIPLSFLMFFWVSPRLPETETIPGVPGPVPWLGSQVDQSTAKTSRRCQTYPAWRLKYTAGSETLGGLVMMGTGALVIGMNDKVYKVFKG